MVSQMTIRICEFDEQVVERKVDKASVYNVLTFLGQK